MRDKDAHLRSTNISPDSHTIRILRGFESIQNSTVKKNSPLPFPFPSPSPSNPPPVCASAGISSFPREDSISIRIEIRSPLFRDEKREGQENSNAFGHREVCSRLTRIGQRVAWNFHMTSTRRNWVREERGTTIEALVTAVRWYLRFMRHTHTQATLLYSRRLYKIMVSAIARDLLLGSHSTKLPASVIRASATNVDLCLLPRITYTSVASLIAYRATNR